MRNLLNNCNIIRVSAGGAGSASATPTKGSIIDMQGWEGVMFLAEMGDVLNTADVDLRVAGADVNDTGQMALLVGEAGGVADATSFDDKVVALDVFKPRQQFLEVQLFHQTADAPFDSILAIQYRGGEMPTVDYDASLVAYNTLNDPDTE